MAIRFSVAVAVPEFLTQTSRLTRQRSSWPASPAATRSTTTFPPTKGSTPVTESGSASARAAAEVGRAAIAAQATAATAARCMSSRRLRRTPSSADYSPGMSDLFGAEHVRRYLETDGEV